MTKKCLKEKVSHVTEILTSRKPKKRGEKSRSCLFVHNDNNFQSISGFTSIGINS